MKIAFDFNPVIKTKFSGFYTFGINLLKGFETVNEDVEFSLFYHRSLGQEAQEAVKDLDSERFKLTPCSTKINKLKKIWKYINFPKLQSFTGKFDIYHSFHNMMPPTGKAPRILTVHDLRRYRLPGFYGKPPKIFESAVKAADHIIAVSDSTKQDICDIFHITENKVSTVHLCNAPGLCPLSPSEKQNVIQQFFSARNEMPSPYLITISATDHRKNISRTIEAFHKVKKDIPGMKLVVAGFLPKDKTELQAINKYAESDKDIVLAGPVDDLNSLIAASEGLLFNSFYEGFGIPILEAFAFDIPVLTSNCSSMPEVGGSAALYADPSDTNEIAAGILEMFSDKRQTLIESGKKRLTDFSWDKSAAATYEVYKKVL